MPEHAKQISVARAIRLEAQNYNVTSNGGKRTIITLWMQSYIDGYRKKDNQNMLGTHDRFKSFFTV